MIKQRNCIFCGRKGGLTKEHFWPDWLRKYLPKSYGDYYISEVHTAEGIAPKQIQNRAERQGNVITKKIRVVCKECNNGWMSKLEENVKPLIVGVIKGHDNKINKNQINYLSLWVAVKTIIGEHAEHHVALTPKADRYQVYKNSIIPAYFRIFTGTHSSEKKATYIRHSTTISFTMDGPSPPLSRNVFRNIQSVSFLVGPLVFHVVSVRVDGFNIDEVFSFGDLVRLWPLSREHIDLSSLNPLDESRMRMIANQLDRLIALPNVQYGGPLPNKS